jgi:hypothetical protein
MEAPLATAGAFEHSNQQPATEPQLLPKALRDDIRRSLAPPLLMQRRLGRWGPGALTGLWLWSMSFCAYRALKEVGAEFVAIVLAAAFPAVGLIFCAHTNRIAAVVCPHVLSQLDEARVSAKGTATLSKTLRGMKALLGYSVLLLGGMSATLAIELKPEAAYEWVAAALLVALAAATGVMAATSQLAQDLAFLLAADAAEQVAIDVHCTTAATADWNALAKRVNTVHKGTVALSQKMTPVLFGMACIQFLTVLIFLFIAVGPRPDGRNWYNTFCNQYFMAVIATFTAGMLVWTLSGPAKITSACQKICSAINDLRLDVGADGAVTLVTSEQLHRIEGLNRYINELNKNQGLGFLVLRKRITFTLVLALMIQTVSGLIVINTTMISFATVEGKEEVTSSEVMDCRHAQGLGVP